MPPSTRSTRTQDTSTQAVHTSALAKPRVIRRASSLQPQAAPSPARGVISRYTRSQSVYPSGEITSSSPSPALDTSTTTNNGTPSPPSELEEETEQEAPEETVLQEDSGEQEEMLHSAGSERSGLRGRNVEDVNALEEEGLLKRVDIDDEGYDEKTRLTPRSLKGKEKETRVERVLDYGANEGDEGLNNPRDRNAFALLVLLCECPFRLRASLLTLRPVRYTLRELQL